MYYFKDLSDGYYAVASLDVKVPEGSVQITEQEAEAIRQSQVIPPTYQQLRAAEYPPMADYLDGVVKNDQAQIAAYIAACEAVKAKYPKP